MDGKIAVSKIIEEIERFKSVAKALHEEGCDSEFIINILIKHLTINICSRPKRMYRCTEIKD